MHLGGRDLSPFLTTSEWRFNSRKISDVTTGEKMVRKSSCRSAVARVLFRQIVSATTNFNLFFGTGCKVAVIMTRVSRIKLEVWFQSNIIPDYGGIGLCSKSFLPPETIKCVLRPGSTIKKRAQRFACQQIIKNGPFGIPVVPCRIINRSHRVGLLGAGSLSYFQDEASVNNLPLQEEVATIMV